MRKLLLLISVLIFIVLTGCSLFREQGSSNGEELNTSSSDWQESGSGLDAEDSDDLPVEIINLPDEYYLKTIVDTYEQSGTSGNRQFDFTLEEARDFSVSIHKDNGTISLSILNQTNDSELYSTTGTNADISDTIHLEPGSYSLCTETSFYRGIIDIESEVT